MSKFTEEQLDQKRHLITYFRYSQEEPFKQLEKRPGVKWDLRFISKARHIASFSKDPSTKTGAVFVKNDKIILNQGYNGFPGLLWDDPEILADREAKYAATVHCEVNGANIAQKMGASVEGSTLYTWPFLSCNRCAVDMISRGVSRVVAPYNNNPRWVESFKKSIEYFLEAGVRINLYHPTLIMEFLKEEQKKLDEMNEAILLYGGTGE